MIGPPGRSWRGSGDITRFRSAAASASYSGAGTIEVSSGEFIRHRLSRAGDRQLNSCLHTMAISQIQRDSLGRDYYLRKRAVGERPERSARQPETTTVDLVYRQLLREAVNQTATRTGRTTGTTLLSSEAGSTPTADAPDKSLTGPASTDLATPNQDRID